MARVPRIVARFNKRVTNPLQLNWAPYLPPWAVIEHVGRASGRSYQTPVIAAVDGNTLYVAVLYGEESDWVQNILRAGSGGVRRGGRRYRLEHPRLTSARQTPGFAGQMLGRVSGRVLRGELSAV